MAASHRTGGFKTGLQRNQPDTFLHVGAPLPRVPSPAAPRPQHGVMLPRLNLDAPAEARRSPEAQEQQPLGASLVNIEQLWEQSEHMMKHTSLKRAARRSPAPRPPQPDKVPQAPREKPSPAKPSPRPSITRNYGRGSPKAAGRGSGWHGGYVALHNESTRRPSDSRCTQTSLNSFHMQQLDEAIDKRRRAQGLAVFKCLESIGTALKWKWFHYWDCLMEQGISTDSLQTILVNVQQNKPAYLAGASVWLRTMSNLSCEQYQVLRAAAFNRWKAEVQGIKYCRLNMIPDSEQLTPGKAELALLMNEVCMPLHGSRELQPMLDTACSLAQWLIRCDNVSVVLEPVGPGGSVDSLVKQVASTGAPLLCNSVSGDGLFNPLLDRFVSDVNAMLLMPILAPRSEGVLGVMVLSKAGDRQFCDNDMLLMGVFCSHLALATAQSLWVKKTRFEQGQLYQVLCAAQDMPLTDRYSEAYARVLRQLMSITEARNCGLYMVKEDKLLLATSVGELPKTAVRGSEAHRAWKAGKWVFCNQDTGATDCPEDFTLLCTPVVLFESLEAASVSRAEQLAQINGTQLRLGPEMSTAAACHFTMQSARQLADPGGTCDMAALLSRLGPGKPEFSAALSEAAAKHGSGAVSLGALGQICAALNPKAASSPAGEEAREDKPKVIGVLLMSHTRRNGGHFNASDAAVLTEYSHVIAHLLAQCKRYAEVSEQATKYMNIQSLQQRIAAHVEQIRLLEQGLQPLQQLRSDSINLGAAAPEPPEVQEGNQSARAAELSTRGVYDSVLERTRNKGEVLVSPRAVKKSTAAEEGSLGSAVVQAVSQQPPMSFLQQANQAAVYATACTSVLESKVHSKAIRIFVESTVGHQRSLLYLDPANMEWRAVAPGRGIAGRLLSAKNSITHRAVSAEEMSVYFDPEVDIPRHQQGGKLLSVPLHLDDGCASGQAGVLQVHQPHFNSEEVAQLELLGSVMATPLLYRRVCEMAVCFGKMDDVLHKAQTLGGDMSGPVAHCLEGIAAMTGAELVGLYHVDFTDGSLVLHTCHAAAEGAPALRDTLGPGQGTAAAALLSGEVVVSCPGDGVFDASVDGMEGFQAAQMAAVPILTNEGVALGMLVCHRSVVQGSVRGFKLEAFTVLKPLLALLQHLLLSMNLADLRTRAQGKFLQLHSLAQIMLGLRNKLEICADQQQKLAQQDAPEAPPEKAPQEPTEDQDQDQDHEQEQQEGLSPELSIVCTHGVCEQELLWRLHQAVGVECAVLWLRRLPFQEGDGMLHKAYCCIHDNPFEAKTNHPRMLPRSHWQPTEPRTVYSSCNLGQGLTGMCALTKEIKNLHLKVIDSKLSSGIADDVLDPSVDVPACVAIKPMSCLWVPLTALKHDSGKLQYHPVPHEAATQRHTRARQKKEAEGLHTVGVLQLLNRQSFLGKSEPFKAAEILYIQSWAGLLFQRIMTRADEQKRELTD